MPYHNPYDYRNASDEERRWRYDDEEEGFSGRHGRFNERRNDVYRNLDYHRGRRKYGSFRNQQRGYRPGGNRDYDRDYRYDRGSPEWERAHPWRRDYNDPEDYENGLGRYSDEEQDYQGRYQHSDYRGYFVNRRPNDRYSRRRQAGYSRDYGRGYGEYTNPGYQQGNAYPSAGMGADYNPHPDYEHRDIYDEDVNFGEGDIGYESEGAFYQDLDEPINYENQNYGPGSGERWFHGGMGPRDYQRSDESISEDVYQWLTRHGQIDARDIEIEVQNGEVFLRGTVPDRKMKWQAEDLADDVTGVKDVHNEIKVTRPNQRWVTTWETPENSQAWANAQKSLNWEAQQKSQDWDINAETSPAGQSNVGAGTTNEGATSEQGMETGTVIQENKHRVRIGMEVIGTGGNSIGRVKEIRKDDFLIDRPMARDVYVPFSAIESVGEQVLINVSARTVEHQGWNKPPLV